MSVTLRIVVESVDDISQKILSREVIKDTPIKPVESIIDLRFRHQEQIDILQKVQDGSGIIRLSNKFLVFFDIIFSKLDLTNSTNGSCHNKPDFLWSLCRYSF